MYIAKEKAKVTNEGGIATVQYNMAKHNAKKVIGKAKEEGRRIWRVRIVRVECSRW